MLLSSSNVQYSPELVSLNLKKKNEYHQVRLSIVVVDTNS